MYHATCDSIGFIGLYIRTDPANLVTDYLLHSDSAVTSRMTYFSLLGPEAPTKQETFEAVGRRQHSRPQDYALLQRVATEWAKQQCFSDIHTRASLPFPWASTQ